MQIATLAYPIADRLYLNVTDRCTLRCAFCPKLKGAPRVRDYDLALPTRPATADIIDAPGDPADSRRVDIDASAQLAEAGNAAFRRRTPGVVG